MDRVLNCIRGRRHGHLKGDAAPHSRVPAQRRSRAVSSAGSFAFGWAGTAAWLPLYSPSHSLRLGWLLACSLEVVGVAILGDEGAQEYFADCCDGYCQQHAGQA